jgi:hypothetical protein
MRVSYPEKFTLILISMSKPTYADRIASAQVMVAGLRNNAEQVARRGLDIKFIDSVDADKSDASTLNGQQEKLKADQKSKTAELLAKLDELDAKMAEAKKVVKLEFPQSRWKEFGIDDKR